MVARLQINLTELFSPLELVKEIIDSGNRYEFLNVILFRANN
jgi:hypothetical protein